MSKKRKEIRNQILSVLRAARVVNPDFIKGNRSIPYEDNKLPAISVYTRAEDQTEEIAQAPRLLRKRIDLLVEVAVTGSDDEKVADNLDDLCEKVEQYLSSDDSLNKKCDDIILQRVDFDYIGEGVTKPYHTALLVFMVKYTDYAPRDRFLQKDITPFEGVDADWTVGHDSLEDDDLVPQEEDDQAHDTVNLPQV